MRNLILISVFYFSIVHGQVWTSQKTWTAEWEQKYSEWVRNHWTTDFFSRRTNPDGSPNVYYGLRKDCADTVYSMRAIFAYEFKLPFAINDPTGGGKTVSNQMTRFDKAANQNQRIRLFLEYLDGLTSTRSLPNDTYPTAINKKAVRAGGLILATAVNHHSWTIKDVLPIGVPWLVYNSRVGAGSGSALKDRQSWPNPGWIFEGDQTPNGHAGFRDWKPISHLTQPAWQVPGYSEEQYRVPLRNWRKWAQTRLAVRTESNAAMLERLTKTACEGLTIRAEAVKEGTEYLRRNPRCMPYETYDIYSTPNRDERLFDDLIALRAAYRDILSAGERETVDSRVLRQMDKIFPFIQLSVRDEAQRMPSQTVDEDSLCPIEYRQGQSMDLSEAKRRLFLGLLSHNPHDDVQYRWGDVKGPSPLAKKCRSWDPWQPDLDQE